MEEVLQVTKNVTWIPKPNECSLILSNKLPPVELITTAFGFITYEGKLLLANLYRSWDIPGGHIEIGEAPVETVCREVYEETFIKINRPQLIGYQKINVYAERPENYKYPYPVSYQVHYIASVKEIHPFVVDNETKGRGFFTLSQLKALPNLQSNMELIKYVLQ